MAPDISWILWSHTPYYQYSSPGNIKDWNRAILGLRIKTSAYGCFYVLGVLFVGVLVMRALLFWVYIGVPDSWKLPQCSSCSFGKAPQRDCGLLEGAAKSSLMDSAQGLLAHS